MSRLYLYARSYEISCALCRHQLKCLCGRRTHFVLVSNGYSVLACLRGGYVEGEPCWFCQGRTADHHVQRKLGCVVELNRFESRRQDGMEHLTDSLAAVDQFEQSLVHGCTVKNVQLRVWRSPDAS